MRKYFHIGSIEEIQNIVNKKFLDNTLASRKQKLSNSRIQVLNPKNNEYTDIKGFFWDEELMRQSKYYATFPSEKIAKIGFVGFRSILDLFFLGRGTYLDVSGLACVKFEIKNSNSVKDQYINGKYIESFSTARISLKNIEIIPIDKIMSQILGLRKPYRPWGGFFSSIYHLVGSVLNRKTWVTRVVRN